jgi:hypothetical protein
METGEALFQVAPIPVQPMESTSVGLPTPLRPVDDASLCRAPRRRAPERRLASERMRSAPVRGHARCISAAHSMQHLTTNLHDHLPFSSSVNPNGAKLSGPIVQTPLARISGSIQRVRTSGAARMGQREATHRSVG